MVCIWPEYQGISYRNPKTLQVEGVDADMAVALASDLGVALSFVDSSFNTLAKDLQEGKCDVAMFAVGITPQRAKSMLFTAPTLFSDIYGITTKANRIIQSWNDIDQPGVVVAVMKGTLHEPVMTERLKQARLVVLDSRMAREREVESGRADVFMTDYPYSRIMLERVDWARLVRPDTTFHLTHYAYAVRPGEEVWLKRLNRFVEQIRRDGRLWQAAQKYRLEEMVIRP